MWRRPDVHRAKRQNCIPSLARFRHLCLHDALHAPGSLAERLWLELERCRWWLCISVNEGLISLRAHDPLGIRWPRWTGMMSRSPSGGRSAPPFGDVATDSLWDCWYGFGGLLGFQDRVKPGVRNLVTATSCRACCSWNALAMNAVKNASIQVALAKSSNDTSEV